MNYLDPENESIGHVSDELTVEPAAVEIQDYNGEKQEIKLVEKRKYRWVFLLIR